MKHNHKQEYVFSPLHWVRLQLDNKVKNPTECIIYTPKNKYGVHVPPTRILLLTNQGLHITTPPHKRAIIPKHYTIEIPMKEIKYHRNNDSSRSSPSKPDP